MAVEYGVGAAVYPIAEYYEAAGGTEGFVESYVVVADDDVAEVGVGRCEFAGEGLD